MDIEAAARPTIASVTAVLANTGWVPASSVSAGFRVRMIDSGVICVEYEPGGPWPDRDEALSAMAAVLSAEGWMVTDAGRVLVSAG
jgi:hypothetical protein